MRYTFREKAQQKKLSATKRSNEYSSPFNWNAEFIPGRNADEYTIIYHQCGLCALGKQEHLERLIPYMYHMDFYFHRHHGWRSAPNQNFSPR